MKKGSSCHASKSVRLTCCVLMIAAMCMSFAACCVQHEYSAATCVSPGVCAKCGKVSDAPLPDHQWQEADCTAPKTCAVCGKTEGEALGHRWNEADCTTPKTCSVCGETEGEAPGHKFGEWTAADADGKQVRTCSVCGEKETRDAPKPPKTVLSDKGLAMTAAEFADYLSGFLPDSVSVVDVKSDGFSLRGRVMIEEGLLSYSSAETVWTVNLVKDSSARYKERIVVMAEDSAKAVGILPYLFDAIAPSLSGTERRAAQNAIADACSGSGTIFGKADLGNCMCTVSCIPQVSSYPMLTFATAKFVNG